eukprot:CAMPEP_0198678748 /NCGR_PEP_ID=MMETSP1468-20131203/1404_1 /TAXON_ID=1461545 /ORGANISM="Mantoniella sp, Strain CCMP1436" /LENGTH=31 /DNA_ID= /DNA_START= /DNA_END= /DNA_ORIENTATION=
MALRYVATVSPFVRNEYRYKAGLRPYAESAR